jgi:hypothetical protein
MKILITILGRARSERTYISRGSNNIAVPVISFLKRLIAFMAIIVYKINTFKFDFNFDPVNKNRTDEERGCIDPRNMAFYQNIRRKNKTNNRQQMTPNKGRKLFKMFFLKGINFNPSCFGKIKGRKCREQNRRIEEIYLFIDIKNMGSNTKHHHNKKMTPHKKNNILKHLNHDEFSNLSCIYSNTKKVKVL